MNAEVIRVLIIEDDAPAVESLERACRAPGKSVAIDVVTTVAEALEWLGLNDFDLIFCDLGLPEYDGGDGERAQTGIPLLERLVTTWAGTPVIVFSGRLTPRIILRYITPRNRQEDLFGQGRRAMLYAFEKEDLPECEEQVADLIREAARMTGVSVVGQNEPQLTVSQVRVLQNVAARMGCDQVVAERLRGGLSSSATLRVKALGPGASEKGQLVVKIGNRERVALEARRATAAASGLPAGVMASLVYVVEAGAGSLGGTAYQVVDPSSVPLYELVSTDEARAVLAVETLQATFAGSAGQIVEQSFTTLRRPLITDSALVGIADLPVEELDFLAQRKVSICERTQHADLHGFNVFVAANGDPMLIDFGDVRRAPASLDPLTLELGWLFHPESPRDSAWPSEQDLDDWFDIDSFCESAPCADFLRACRVWTNLVKATDAEVASIVLSYALRQLQYGNPSETLARRLVTVAVARLTELSQ